MKIIAIVGGSGSGKSTLSEFISEHNSNVSILKQDNYYKTPDSEDYNFDDPKSIDWKRLVNDIQMMKKGLEVKVPQYDFINRERMNEEKDFVYKDIIIIEGTLLLSKVKLRKLVDLSIYIDTPSHIRYSRRLKRDTEIRGRTPEAVKKQFLEQVEPMHIQFIETHKHHADMLIKDNNSTEVLNNKLIELMKLISS